MFVSDMKGNEASVYEAKDRSDHFRMDLLWVYCLCLKEEAEAPIICMWTETNKDFPQKNQHEFISL